ncbi:MAG: HlyD family secretion protein [Silvanigrellaceae bacterium]|nr:HlyD family secretion protein [Silvanigrellaceae bacterium]
METFIEENQNNEQPPSITKKAPNKSNAKILLFILTIASIIIGGSVYFFQLNKETTDDAQVDGRISIISSKVAGEIKEILVSDNQQVEIGTPLLQIDPTDYQTELESADAQYSLADASLQKAISERNYIAKTSDANIKSAQGLVTQANSSITSSEATIFRAKADVQSQEARLKLSSTELNRFKHLYQKQAISRSELDAVEARHIETQSKYNEAIALLKNAEAALKNSQGTVESASGKLMAASLKEIRLEAAQASILLAYAKLKQSSANIKAIKQKISNTLIKSPIRGIVSKRRVDVGDYVVPNSSLFSIVSLDDVWILANFKEDQLRQIKVGQRVKASIDTYSNRNFQGVVESIGGATGAKFSLLPPDNASGNFIKVVQRIPVIIKIEKQEKPVLRLGMSAEVTVYTKTEVDSPKKG